MSLAHSPAPTPDHQRHRVLRLEVGRLRQRQPRRLFETTVCVGVLGADRTTAVLDTPGHSPDAGLRAAIVDRMVAVSPEADAAWLERPGEPVLQDLDQAWSAAATLAFASAGRRLSGFWVLTRTGWLDVRTGEHRRWVRLRL